MATSKEPTQVLLLGAGELGLALLSHIISLPHTHITVGVRSPSKYVHLLSPTTSLLELDLSSPSSTLVSIFNEFDVVISATGYPSSPSSVLKLANEMLAAGQLRKKRGEGRLWYFPWQWGVEYDVTLSCHSFMPLFKAQKRVRDLLRDRAEESGVKWTVVSTGMFMSFLFEPSWGIVCLPRSDEEGGEAEGVVTVRCLRDWEHGVTVTDVHDIGRVLVRILKGNVKSENRVLYAAGDSVRYGELADIVERVIGHQVVRESWSVDHLREELRRDPEGGIEVYRLAFAGEGVWWEKERTVNYQLGMDMMDVEAYARKLLGAEK